MIKVWSFLLQQLIQKIFIKIKEVSINHIKSQRPLIKESEMQWRVTVPEIWKNKNKEIMIKSSKIDKIFNQKDETSFFSLEPEAAAYNYAFYNNIDKGSIKIANKNNICGEEL